MKGGMMMLLWTGSAILTSRSCWRRSETFCAVASSCLNLSRPVSEAETLTLYAVAMMVRVAWSDGAVARQ